MVAAAAPRSPGKGHKQANRVKRMCRWASVALGDSKTTCWKKVSMWADRVAVAEDPGCRSEQVRMRSLARKPTQTLRRSGAFGTGYAVRAKQDSAGHCSGKSRRGSFARD